eukprot:CAMPEP_0113655706 /NCGR_PEP_ID=MMETSP0017_2-20120614/29872_1 /TAXON_ID=2856 /ORGANISM="Cylindrotheca closterium" /LENGTH=403 /DNA_ID=CAMNT_0000569017 /DNA_START=13 /DNA_END=1224 /DNA_ORIENTATION=+ /assembly_acc=CAM_ASM_000147
MAALVVNAGSAMPGSNANFKDEIQHATVEDLKRTATLVVADETADSGVYDSALEEKIPRFEMKEVRLGRTLGRGGFCTVTEIEKVKISGERGDDTEWKSVASESRKDFDTQSEPFSRTQMALLSRKKSRKKGGYFALKQVTLELASVNKVNYLKGLVDLSTEAKLLAALDHENIIRLCGVSMEGFSDFIIIERLQETLSGRLKKWMKTERQCKGITGVFTGSKMKKLALDRERMSTAYSIATGLDYLHSRNVIFRDLKPDNVGFDGHGTTKVFDFGLAKELKESRRTDDGLYQMTSFTGAVRYMAPEVGLGMPYNLSVDVYSWSMILWFILALEPPYGFYTEDMIIDRVFKRGSRPAVFESWSHELGNLMKCSWDSTISKRPGFSEICSALRSEMSIKGAPGI